jgi:predicted deacylase
MCGQTVRKGEGIGTITDPFGDFKEQIIAPDSGFIIGLNNIPVIHAGDALIHLGLDSDSSQLTKQWKPF